MAKMSKVSWAPRPVVGICALAAIAAVFFLARLSVFMADASRVECSAVPSSDWETRHSCLSAYYVAAQAAQGDVSIYDSSLYNLPDDDPTKLRSARMLGAFRVDVYEYPPPFLLLPRALFSVTTDFERYRFLWYGLNVIGLFAGMVVAARALGAGGDRAVARRALLFLPFVWLALPTHSTLQKGNVQGLVIALAVLAMAAFAAARKGGRWATVQLAVGGLLLAFAIVSKIYPGLLVVYLLARRDLRAIASTAIFGGVLTGLALWDLGPAPFVAFVHHLPGLLGGEAFPAFRNPRAMAINYSIPGLIWKLKVFGVPGMGFPASKLLGWLFTLVIVPVTYVAGRRSAGATAAARELDGPILWLAILILATLRSPFLPQAYAALPPLWLLSLLAARATPSWKVFGGLIAGWLALNLFWPMDWPLEPRALALLTLVPQAVTVGLAFWAARSSGGDTASPGDSSRA
jgi:alpha-1,2-mannosyltransferase